MLLALLTALAFSDPIALHGEPTQLRMNVVPGMKWSVVESIEMSTEYLMRHVRNPNVDVVAATMTLKTTQTIDFKVQSITEGGPAVVSLTFHALRGSARIGDLSEVDFTFGLADNPESRSQEIADQLPRLPIFAQPLLLIKLGMCYGQSVRLDVTTTGEVVALHGFSDLFDDELRDQIALADGLTDELNLSEFHHYFVRLPNDPHEKEVQWNYELSIHMQSGKFSVAMTSELAESTASSIIIVSSGTRKPSEEASEEASESSNEQESDLAERGDTAPGKKLVAKKMYFNSWTVTERTEIDPKTCIAAASSQLVTVEGGIDAPGLVNMGRVRIRTAYEMRAAE